MSCIYENIKCPKCFNFYDIEKRQEIIFCVYCGDYFDRDGNIRKYDRVKSSSTPLYTRITNTKGICKQCEGDTIGGLCEECDQGIFEDVDEY